MIYNVNKYLKKNVSASIHSPSSDKIILLTDDGEWMLAESNFVSIAVAFRLVFIRGKAVRLFKKCF